MVDASIILLKIADIVVEIGTFVSPAIGMVELTAGLYSAGLYSSSPLSVAQPGMNDRAITSTKKGIISDFKKYIIPTSYLEMIAIL